MLPSHPRATIQQLTLRHILEDLNLKPSDLLKHLVEKVGSLKTLLNFVLGVSGSNPRLSIYYPNRVNGDFCEYIQANFGVLA
jgi:hypothetical protein